MEEVCSPETFVFTYKSTRRYNPEIDISWKQNISFLGFIRLPISQVREIILWVGYKRTQSEPEQLHSSQYQGDVRTFASASSVHNHGVVLKYSAQLSNSAPCKYQRILR
jgi:hypothetical protein